MKKVRFLRFSYFIWILVPTAIWLTYNTHGVPHMAWSYDWVDQGQGYNPLVERWYTRCTYIGAYGNFTTLPTNGECPFLRFEKKRGGV